MATEPTIYDIEDYETGKLYKVEAYEDGTTYDEAVDWFSGLSDEERAEYEYTPQTPVQAPASAERAPTPVTSVEQPAEASRPATPWDRPSAPTQEMTRTRIDRSDANDYAFQLFNQGVTEAADLDKALAERFPEFEGYKFSQADLIKASRAKEAASKSGTAFENPFNIQQYTGLTDPERPEGVLDTIGNAAQRGLYNMANNLRGVGAVGADLVGADETSEEMFQEYARQQQAANYHFQRPEAAESYKNVDSFGDAALYVADTLGEVAPQLAGTLSAGGVGGLAGRVIGGTASKTAAKYGAAAAVAADSVIQNTGSTAGDTYVKTGERAPVSSILAGVASGALDTILPMTVLKRLGVSNKAITDRLVPRMMKTGVKDFSTEAATEAAQTFIQGLPASVITGESPFTAETLDNMIESFIRGGIAGGTVGATSGAAQRRTPTPGESSIRAPTVVPGKDPAKYKDAAEYKKNPAKYKEDVAKYKENAAKYEEEIAQATSDIDDLVNTTLSKWNQETKPKVKVHQNFKNLKGVKNGAVGVYLGNGEIAINTENVLQKAKNLGVTPDSVVNAMLFHEGLGHYGLDVQFGQELDINLLKWYDGNEQFRQDVDSWIKAHPKSYKSTDPDVTIARAAEEVLAGLSESGQRKLGVYDTLANLVKNAARAMGWDMDVSYREIRSLLALSHSRVGEAGMGTRVLQRLSPKAADSTGTNTPRYMYVGEGFDGMGDAQKARLATAKLAASRGQNVGPDSQIRKDTSWFKGKDGQWRFEIDDNNIAPVTTRDMELLHQVAEQYGKPTSTVYYKTDGRSSLNILADPIDESDYHGINVLPLTEVIQHHELFSGYPELAEVAVTRSWDIYNDLRKEKKNYHGYYDPRQNLIYVNPKLSEREATSTLLHEVQHVVQRLEGFETGGNVSSVMGLIPLKTLKKGVENYERFLKADLSRKKQKVAVYEGIWNHPDVQAIRQSYNDINDLANEIDETDPENTSYIEVLEQELEKVYQEQSKAYNRLKKFANVEDWEAATQQERDEFYEMYELFLKDTVTDQDIADTLLAPKLDVDLARERLKRLRHLRATGDNDGLRQLISEDKFATHQAYEHIDGEVEARDVQKRWEQNVNRRETVPYSLEDKIDPEGVFTKANYNARNDELSASDPKYMMMDDTPPASENVVDFQQAKEDKELKGFHQSMSEQVRGKAKEYSERVQSYRDEGKLPLEIGQRFTTPKSLETGSPPWRVTGYFVDPKDPDKFGYAVERGEGETFESGRLAVSDPKSDARIKENRPTWDREAEINSWTMLNGPSAGPKYMMLDDIPPINPDELNADELLASENAVDLLLAATRDYTSEPISDDQIEAEAQARGVSVAALIKAKSLNPGDLARRIRMLDIAADKTMDKLARLYDLMQTGKGTPQIEDQYLRTLAQMQDLTDRIFTENSEYGRALRTVKDSNYTKRRAENVLRILSGLQNGIDLSDPDAVYKFATDVQAALKKQGKESGKEKGARVAANVLNLPRAVMSSLDFSAPLRQGVLLIGTPEFYKALPTMFKAYFSEGTYKDLMTSITRRPTYKAMLKGKVSFSSLDGKLSNREEDFMSDWANYIPGVRRSNRAYAAFLNKLRADSFDTLYNSALKHNPDVKDDLKAIKAIGEYVNVATGRGDLGNFLQSSAPLLNAVLFSPRLIAARLKTFRPATYTRLPKGARRRALVNLATFGTAALTVMSLAVMAGAEVEKDPRSSDFGKIKVGNTRYDVLGGLGQYGVLGTRLALWLGGSAYESATGEEGPDHYKSVSGNTSKLNEEDAGPYGMKAGNVVMQFGRNKLAPVPAYLVDALYGENTIGEEFNPVDVSRFAPMFLQDVYDMQQEYGVGEGTARVAPALFGVGVQDFTPENLDPEAEQKAPKTFEMNDLDDGENDDIKVKDGVVTVKEPLREEWSARINQLVTEWMKDEMADPAWKKMTDLEKEEVIAEVRKDARAQAKEEMLESIGL